MNLQHVDILFQLIVFLFAISVHESAHAWMANRRGDPTARMLGRITLNPIKHIDPVGTVLLPAIALFASSQTGHNIPVLGWAKPTPVDPRNFRNPVLDDILTSVVGPISNFLVATAATIILAAIMLVAPGGRMIVQGILSHVILSNSALVPFTLLLYDLLLINVVLAVFNLIPVPPLDGSHVLRHFLSEPVRRAYDTMGWLGLMALVYLAPGLLSSVIRPFMALYISILMSI
jgi:Zn-dependent protease